MAARARDIFFIQNDRVSKERERGETSSTHEYIKARLNRRHGLNNRDIRVKGVECIRFTGNVCGYSP